MDTVTASRHKNMKELRPGSSGRQAIMLVPGDKSGNWTRWYKKNIPLADDLFDDHLRTLKGQ